MRNQDVARAFAKWLRTEFTIERIAHAEANEVVDALSFWIGNIRTAVMRNGLDRDASHLRDLINSSLDVAEAWCSLHSERFSTILSRVGPAEDLLVGFELAARKSNDELQRGGS